MLKRTRRTFISKENGKSGAKSTNEIDASNLYRDATEGNGVCLESFGKGTEEKHM